MMEELKNFCNESGDGDNRLKNWKKWLNVHKNLYVLLEKKMNRKTESLLMNRFINEKRYINQEKIFMEKSNTYTKGDHYRGNTNFWKFPVSLKCPIKTLQPCYISGQDYDRTKPEPAIPCPEFVCTPDKTLLEQGMANIGSENIRKWKKSPLVMKRFSEIQTRIKRKIHRPNYNDLIILGEEIRFNSFSRSTGTLGLDINQELHKEETNKIQDPEQSMPISDDKINYKDINECEENCVYIKLILVRKSVIKNRKFSTECLVEFTNKLSQFSDVAIQVNMTDSNAPTNIPSIFSNPSILHGIIDTKLNMCCPNVSKNKTKQPNLRTRSLSKLLNSKHVKGIKNVKFNVHLNSPSKSNIVTQVNMSELSPISSTENYHCVCINSIHQIDSNLQIKTIANSKTISNPEMSSKLIKSSVITSQLSNIKSVKKNKETQVYKLKGLLNLSGNTGRLCAICGKRKLSVNDFHGQSPNHVTETLFPDKVLGVQKKTDERFSSSPCDVRDQSEQVNITVSGTLISNEASVDNLFNFNIDNKEIQANVPSLKAASDDSKIDVRNGIELCKKVQNLDFVDENVTKSMNSHESLQSINSTTEEVLQPFQITLLFGNCKVNHRYERTIVFVNENSVSIRYEWQQRPITENKFTNPKSLKFVPKFFFNTNSGVIVPGESKNIQINFKSNHCGIFLETWELTTIPPTKENNSLINFESIVLDQTDESKWKCVKMYLESRVMKTYARNKVNEIIMKVKPDSSKSLPYCDKLLEEEIFIHNNPDLFYESNSVQILKDLNTKVTSKNWDYSIENLRQNILQIKLPDLKAQFLDIFFIHVNKLMKPTEKSVLYNKKYKSVYEILCSFVNKMEDEGINLKRCLHLTELVSCNLSNNSFDYKYSKFKDKHKKHSSKRNSLKHSKKSIDTTESFETSIKNNTSDFKSDQYLQFLYVKTYKYLCSSIEDIVVTIESISLGQKRRLFSSLGE